MFLRHVCRAAPSQGAWRMMSPGCWLAQTGNRSDATPAVTRAESRFITHTILAANKSKEYPTEPRVGVGAVVLRNLKGVEVLLIKRGKEPNKGMWSFPGGSLELGERICECAVREVREETGLELYSRPDEEAEATRAAAEKRLQPLHVPTAFAAADSISHDTSGDIVFHYALIEVAAKAVDPSASVAAADDVDDVQWTPLPHLLDMERRKELTSGCANLARVAAERFLIN
ncbi:hypothetical protein WJX72_007207 [[Myrmecia] bisecta]|uniref:Nudix hydrolase domain-containing protein n=1 Tax=[Myrmecia] bisecta TaxID=41462 RepID=A0AAW1Q7L5_9CHLO